MAHEAKKWRDAQPPMPAEGTGLGRERQGGDETMDVDVSEEEDLDDDIIEGCYSLEIGIKGFLFPRIWIRAEYIRIYNALEDRHQSPHIPIWHQPSSLQANQVSVSPGDPLSHGSS
jgi:hypothetical protein